MEDLPHPLTQFPSRQAHGINHGVQEIVGLAERHVRIGCEDPVRQSAERTHRQRAGRVSESEGDRVEGVEPLVSVEGFGQRREVERRAQGTLHVGQEHVVGVPVEDQSPDGARGTGEQSHRHRSADERARCVGDLVAIAEERIEVAPRTAGIALAKAQHRAGQEGARHRKEGIFDGEREGEHDRLLAKPRRRRLIGGEAPRRAPSLAAGTGGQPVDGGGVVVEPASQPGVIGRAPGTTRAGLEDFPRVLVLHVVRRRRGHHEPFGGREPVGGREVGLRVVDDVVGGSRGGN